MVLDESLLVCALCLLLFDIGVFKNIVEYVEGKTLGLGINGENHHGLSPLEIDDRSMGMTIDDDGGAMWTGGERSREALAM